VILYHVTFTSNVASIKERGLLTFQTSNWVKAGDLSRYGNGEVHAFEQEIDAWRWAAKMDWEHHKDTGSGKVSIVKLISPSSHHWDEDKGDPLSRASHKGRWLKSSKPVPREYIYSAESFTLEMARDIVRETTAQAAWQEDE
jgi:hypothetical protein